jgi:hypothetical protein
MTTQTENTTPRRLAAEQVAAIRERRNDGYELWFDSFDNCCRIDRRVYTDIDALLDHTAALETEIARLRAAGAKVLDMFTERPRDLALQVRISNPHAVEGEEPDLAYILEGDMDAVQDLRELCQQDDALAGDGGNATAPDGAGTGAR